VLKKMVRAGFVTGIGTVVGVYAWSLAKAAAYGNLLDDDDEHEGAYDWSGEEREDYLESWEEHQENCPSCSALGTPGVMNGPKLRAIAQWMMYSDSLLEEMLDLADDLPPSMTEDKMKYLMEALGSNTMASDIMMWAEMLDVGDDPTSEI
jgi:hypothetical protein